MLSTRAAIAALSAAAFPVFAAEVPLTRSEPLVITVTRFEDRDTDRPVNLSVISAEDIRASSARTVPDLLAEQAVEDLADLFRASLSDASARISLKDELEIARTHQRIEQLRLGERLTVHWDIDDLPMRTLVPSLMIQPLLENAVYHGIETLPRGGEISIVGRRDDHAVRIEVRNPILAHSSYSEREGNRIALDNIRQRLELAWPGRARLETEQTEAEFCARLIFPYAREEAVGG